MADTSGFHARSDKARRRRELAQDVAALIAVILFGMAAVLWCTAAEFYVATGGW